jgi:hypothetical protein
MLRGIRITPHQAATTTSFVRKNIAPWITHVPWPPREMIEHLKSPQGKDKIAAWNGQSDPKTGATNPVMGCPRM